VAAIRDGTAHTNPPPDWRFQLGDILVVIGAHREVDEAERLLSGDAGAQGGGSPSESR
jgi:Trk K+ transport system NAD-binding subunit